MKKLYSRTNSWAKALHRSLGIDIQKMSDLDVQINRLHSIKNPKRKLIAANELVNKYPQHPKVHLELAQCLHDLSDPNMFEQLGRYSEARQEWFIQTGLGELGMEFIQIVIVVGSLGNHGAIESLLRANQYGLRPAKKPFLLLPENAQLRNPALFEYFEPHLCVIRDGEAIQHLKSLERLLALPLGLGLPLHNSCPYLLLAGNRNEMERERQGLEPALFQLSDHHREMGMHALDHLGLPGDAWYVTLHVREPGYRGEIRSNTIQNPRNANPLDYLKAIKAVTEAGGWVFRMGDPSMTPMPSLPRLIDYAHHEVRCDYMDVFLGATCRFCIATDSGYYTILNAFGKPILLTNVAAISIYYMLNKQDLFLPRLLKTLRTGKSLTFEQQMSQPICSCVSDKHYRDAGVYWVENTPEELEYATRQMLERTVGITSSKIPDDDLQRRFKTTAEACDLKCNGRPMKAFAPVSRDFLVRHAHLLRGDL